MILRKLKNKPHITLQIGLTLLAFANIVRFIGGRMLGPDNDRMDFFNGMLMGVSIAMLLLSIIYRRNWRNNA
jgi:hypothetical protein